jgi:hypothetical protein
MSEGPYFTGKSGTQYYYADIAARLHKEAPHTLGKHVSVQLEAIGLLEEMKNGTTPCGLPYTFAEASYTPGPWDCDGRTIICAAPHEADQISMIEVRANVNEVGWETVAFIEAIWPGAVANARLITAAPELLEALKDLLGDQPSVQHGQCVWCGRDYRDPQTGDCPSDDCPSSIARAAIAKATPA